MEMNWPLAVVVVALLMFGYCAYTASQAPNNMHRATEEAALYQRCYTAGYDAGYDGESRVSPDDSEACVNWFESGLSDGRRAGGY